MRISNSELTMRNQLTGGNQGMNTQIQSAEPLAQDYTVVFHNPDREYYVEGCGLVRLDHGVLVAAVPVVPRFVWSKERRVEHSWTHILSSEDGGKTWNKLSELPYYSACPWVYNGALYMFTNKGGKEYRNDDILLLRSKDGGKTWSEPVALFEGHFWNCHTGMVIRDSTLYWSVDDLDIGGVPYNSPFDIPLGAQRAPRVVAGDLTRDLMDPASWRMSNPAAFPGQAEVLENARFMESSSHYLEPNMIDVNGQLRVLVTVKLRGQSTANVCAVLDVTDDGSQLATTFTQYSYMPGGQLKFCVIWDEVSQMFWATANLAVDSQKQLDWKESDELRDQVYAQIPGGDDRRFLMLFYGLDGLNWFQAGCIARGGRVNQSFMYAKPVIDGDDLAIISRTCLNAPNRHDADHATFHRVRDFRRLALNLHPDA